MKLPSREEVESDTPKALSSLRSWQACSTVMTAMRAWEEIHPCLSRCLSLTKTPDRDNLAHSSRRFIQSTMVEKALWNSSQNIDRKQGEQTGHQVECSKSCPQ